MSLTVSTRWTKEAWYNGFFFLICSYKLFLQQYEQQADWTSCCQANAIKPACEGRKMTRCLQQQFPIKKSNKSSVNTTDYCKKLTR